MDRKKRLFLLLFLIIAALLYPLSTPAEQEGANILFIFDASGSMRGAIEGKSKLKTAKEVLSALVGDLPADANVGLEAYGHRISRTEKNKSCQDIEMLVPVKRENLKIIIKKLNSLNAKGMTPISASLEKGADVMRGLSGKKTIILISDGEETCGGDPVGVAGKIKNEFGVDVVIHVIGFDVKEKEKMQLAGIAKAGGGTYYAADNAQQLKDSLVQIKKAVVEKAPPKEKKVVKKEPPKDIFVEEFDKPFLSEEWEIINDNPDGRVLDEGKFIVIEAPGSIVDETIQNMLLYKKPIPSANVEISVKFNTSFLNFSGWITPSQHPGLILYSDKDNWLALFMGGDKWKGNHAAVVFAKTKDGKINRDSWLAYHFFGKPVNEITYQLKIVKEKYKYTAYVYDPDKGDWQKIGTYGILGKKFQPGIIAYRDNGTQEVITEFDWFRIKELE